MKKGIVIMAVGIMLTAVCSCKDSVRTRQQSEQQAKEIAEAGNSDTQKEPEYRIVRNMIVPTSGRPAIVDFYADWCPPCKALKPIFKKLSEEYAGRIDFISINVDENPDISSQYVGEGIPTIAFLLPDGNVAGTWEGLLTEENLRTYLDNLLEATAQYNRNKQ